MSFDKLPAKTFTEAPPPHFSCLVRTATEELSNSDTRHLLAPPSSSLSSPKRLSSAVFSHISPQSSALSPTTSSLLSPTPSATSRNRARRNTICHKIQETSGIEDNNKNSLNPPKILRRSSAPHLNMKEISTLSKAGISTTNLLNLITVSDSLEKISKV